MYRRSIGHQPLSRRVFHHLHPQQSVPSPASPLSPTEFSIAVAVAQAAIPAGRSFPEGGTTTVERAIHLLDGLPSHVIRRYRTLLHAIDVSTLFHFRARFQTLPLEQRRVALARFDNSHIAWLRGLLRVTLFPIQYAHFDTDNYFQTVRLPRLATPPLASSPPNWHRQMTRGTEVTDDMEIECEVVVVGTGAGGAACAYELASRGRAVLMVEQGALFDRSNMRGHPFESFKKMYLNHGLTLAVGNTTIPVWAGQTVGGSTTINSGTCYRAPDRVLSRWVRRYDLTALSPQSLSPLYDRVETMLDVQTAPASYLGGVARVVARGADRLGYSHGPVPRNAPGCDGAGTCAFGCPTGAKRSTDVSYVPAALTRGAQLITDARVHIITQHGGKATGVVATLASGRTLRVKAEAVVIAGGAMLTPNLLRNNGISVGNPWLGRNLSIHPAAKVFGVFDEHIDMVKSAIPQGYAVDEFKDEGLMLEGASLSPVTTAFSMGCIGEEFSQTMDAYRHLALYGFMIQDHSRGRVLPGPTGSARMIYRMSKRDAALLHKGLVEVNKILLAAGAKRVVPFARGVPAIRSWGDLEQFQRKTLRPSDVELTAYHPLGTCRIGSSPERSVLSPEHETWDLRDLYVTDGSAIPSSLGVNPQLTIMAMALRAAEIIDSKLPN